MADPKPRGFTANQRRGLLVAGVLAIAASVALLLYPLTKTTTATVTGQTPSKTVTKEDDRSDTFATGVFALGVVLFAGGLGISLTYGGVSAAAGLAELAKAHAKAVESGREDDIAVTRNALDVGAQSVLRSLQ